MPRTRIGRNGPQEGRIWIPVSVVCPGTYQRRYGNWRKAIGGNDASAGTGNDASPYTIGGNNAGPYSSETMYANNIESPNPFGWYVPEGYVAEVVIVPKVPSYILDNPLGIPTNRQCGPPKREEGSRAPLGIRIEDLSDPLYRRLEDQREPSYQERTNVTFEL
jgi:hypothetical protein